MHDSAWLDGAGDYVDIAQQGGGGHERQTTSRLSIWTSATPRQGHVDALDRIASLSEGAAPVKDVRGDGLVGAVASNLLIGASPVSDER